MRNRSLLLVGLLLTVANPVWSQAAAPQVPVPSAEPTAEQWRDIARKDVLAAYQLYVDNHPGMYDRANPGFPERLKRARNAGLALAERATSRRHYVDALGAFTAEISDGHAQAFAKSQPAGTSPPQRSWPGFIAAWRGDGALVHQAEANFPVPAGSEILGCDGLPAVDFIRKQIVYRGFRPEEAGLWWLRSTQAFYAVAGAGEGPKRCTFRLADGKSRELALSYEPTPENFSDRIAKATDGDKTPIGLSEPRPDIFLIGMPNFNPDAEGVKAYRALFESLKQRRAQLLKARAVVIDLRHNNGGSSAWSRDGAQALWGEEAVNQRMGNYFKDVRIWWRASQGNVAYMDELEADIRKAGHVEGADDTAETAKGMKAALADGKPFYVEGDEEVKEARPAKPIESDFKTPVYVITPGRCGSACLDAVDAFTRFENVQLIGAPTSADSTYMEVRPADLPSGLGRVVIPTKIWVGRPRGSGQVYQPHILVTDLDWSTETFLDRVEADLKARR